MFALMKKGWRKAAQFVTETTAKAVQFVADESGKLVAAVLGLTVTGSAMAALPAGVSDAITAAQADVTSAGGLILVVVVSIAAIMWIRHVLR